MWMKGDEYDDEGNRRNPVTGRPVSGFRNGASSSPASPYRKHWSPTPPVPPADPTAPTADPLQAEAERFAANIARKKGTQVTPQLVAWALKALKAKGGISEELFLELVSVA